MDVIARSFPFKIAVSIELDSKMGNPDGCFFTNRLKGLSVVGRFRVSAVDRIRSPGDLGLLQCELVIDCGRRLRDALGTSASGGVAHDFGRAWLAC
jgi:hypothetical protein